MDGAAGRKWHLIMNTEQMDPNIDNVLTVKWVILFVGVLPAQVNVVCIPGTVATPARQCQ